MKKISILAIAAVMSLGLAGCSKESAEVNNGGELRTTELTIKVAGEETTRLVGGNATAVTTTISDGVIAIQAPSGGAITFTDIDAAEIGEGQKIANVVLGSDVYVVANIPTAAYKTAVKAATSIDALKEVALSIADQAEVALTGVAVSGSGTVPGTDTDADRKETLSITAKPIVARIELGKVSSVASDEDALTPEISSFKVTGVYLNGAFPQVKWSAAGAGTEMFVGSPVVAGNLTALTTAKQGETQNKTATGTAPAMSVSAGAANQSWGYNIAANTMPFIVVELSNVALEDGSTTLEMPDGSEATLATDKFYLTVSAYKDGGTALTTFAPGNVYNISNIEFDVNDLGTAPIEKVELTVDVTVTPWAVKAITAEI